MHLLSVLRLVSHIQIYFQYIESVIENNLNSLKQQSLAFASANLITDSMCLTVIGMDPVAIDSRLKSEYIFDTFALSISSFGFI